MSTVTSRLERGMVSAEQLADLIARKINVAGVEIAVRKHHAFGWTPTVLSAPANPISFQSGRACKIEAAGLAASSANVRRCSVRASFVRCALH